METDVYANYKPTRYEGKGFCVRAGLAMVGHSGSTVIIKASGSNFES